MPPGQKIRGIATAAEFLEWVDSLRRRYSTGFGSGTADTVSSVFGS